MHEWGREEDESEIRGTYFGIGRPQARGVVHDRSTQPPPRFQRIGVTFSQWPTPDRGGGARVISLLRLSSSSAREGFLRLLARFLVGHILVGNDGHQEHVVSRMISHPLTSTARHASAHGLSPRVPCFSCF